MKLFFLDGNEEWFGLARMLGYDVGFVPVEDSKTNVLFIPEYVPVSHVRRTFKNSSIVVVWRDYDLGVMENVRHSINVVTDPSLLEKVQNSTFIPEGVSDIFSILCAVSKDANRTHTIENDEEIMFKTTFERAHIFKNTKAYKGKQYVKEAWASGCDVVVAKPFHVDTKETVAKHLSDFLEKLKIFQSINNTQ